LFTEEDIKPGLLVRDKEDKHSIVIESYYDLNKRSRHNNENSERWILAGLSNNPFRAYSNRPYSRSTLAKYLNKRNKIKVGYISNFEKLISQEKKIADFKITGAL
jgi:hypothetical protein